MADMRKSLAKLKVIELKEKLTELGKTPKGLKADLVNQLAEAYEEETKALADTGAQHQTQYQPPSAPINELANSSLLSNALQTSEPNESQRYYQQSVPQYSLPAQQVYEQPPEYMQTNYPEPYQYAAHISPVFSSAQEQQYNQTSAQYQMTSQLSPRISTQMSPQLSPQMAPQMAPQMTSQLSPQLAQQYRPQEFQSPHRSFPSNESDGYHREYSGPTAPEPMPHYGMTHMSLQPIPQTQTQIPSIPPTQLVHRQPVIEGYATDIPQTMSSDMSAYKPPDVIESPAAFIGTHPPMGAPEGPQDIIDFDDVTLGVDPTAEVQYSQSIGAFVQNQNEFEITNASHQFHRTDVRDGQSYSQPIDANRLQELATNEVINEDTNEGTEGTNDETDVDSNDSKSSEESNQSSIEAESRDAVKQNEPNFSEQQVISESTAHIVSDTKAPVVTDVDNDPQFLGSTQLPQEFEENSSESVDTDVESDKEENRDENQSSDSIENSESLSQTVDESNSIQSMAENETINVSAGEVMDTNENQMIRSEERFETKANEEIESQTNDSIESNASLVNEESVPTMDSELPEAQDIIEAQEPQEPEVIQIIEPEEQPSLQSLQKPKPVEPEVLEELQTPEAFESSENAKSIEVESTQSSRGSVIQEPMREKMSQNSSSSETRVEAKRELRVPVEPIVSKSLAPTLNANQRANNRTVISNEPKTESSVKQNGIISESKSNKKLTKNQKKKQRKKLRANRRQTEVQRRNDIENDDRMDIEEEDNEEDVEIEYIPEQVQKDPIYFQYLRVFEKFRTGETDRREDPLEDEIIDPVKRMMERKKPVEMELKDEDEKKDGESKLSKRKLKQMTRMTVSELKQRVSHPELVEMHDVTARDPLILLHLKATRNSVPVPRHWCYKRKYLQGKRGFEKPPFKLPEFIRKTGIMEMRQALQEKEESKSLKAKMREKIRPKMGKIDIDYQKLHDAFFKWQTKPKMTIHGDLYYEGKEFETRLKEKKPGELSNELRTALGMPTGPNSQKCPPPWLIAMQRYGPPPSYPNIKIPGLNAPIPDGCSFGYHAGGWGKPPVDEYGRPLYGDVFGVSTSGDQNLIEEEVDRTLWGEMESESEEEEEEESEEEETDATAAAGKPANAKEVDETGFVTPAEGLITPSGMTSMPTGMETPDMIELRKRKQIEAEMESVENPALFTVIPEKKADKAGREMMASAHTYDMSAATLRKGQGIDVALDPSDLEAGALDTASMAARYEQTMKEQSSHLAKEDLSDMVAEHAARQKRKNKQDTSKSAKKYQFKF